MLVGYARTSTAEQEAGLEAQIRDLKAAGCERIFSERVSSVGARPQWEEAKRFVREGDTLMVTKPDRLARSVHDLTGITKDMRARKVTLRILSMDLDTSTATGALILNVLGSVAEFERSLMLERQREGIAAAKAEGKYTGRKPTARAKADEVLRLKREGVSGETIAKQVGISPASVWRIVKGAKNAA
ncbi:recombinase family protein [Roseomonas sp. DSM 102946]|nr:recombinase family protein [Roseomonas sp. DSM 102946]